MSSTPRVTRSRRASIAPTASIRAESPVAKPAPRVRARASAKVDPQPESSSHSIVPAAAVDDGTYTDNDGQTQHQQQDTVDADRPVRWYYDPADNATVQNVTIDFMYNPHSLLALAVFLAAILGAFFYYDSNAYSAIENIKNGLALAAGVFLLIGLLVFPSGPFTRPHPMFWRLVFGVSLLYELVLVVMLMLNREQARFSLTYLYPNLNQPLVEKQYAAHCELTWENVKPAVFDIFFVSHFLGWLCKSLMMRDLLFCWTLSVGWELIEIAFMHMLPNFAECWWDQWILDVMLANGIGIYCGHLIAQHLEVKQYKWSGLYTYSTLMGKATRFLLQFTPESWTKVKWENFSLIRQFLIYNVLMFSLHLVELNAFFLKHILWVPPENKLNLYRLVLWWLIGVVSLRQIYMYMNNPKIKRLGSQAWMAIAIQLTELLICIKFGDGVFNEPMPHKVFYAWCAFGIVYVSFIIWVALRHEGSCAH